MLASSSAAERGARVLLLEQNDRLGKKLRLTGKGRCNVTNDCTVAEALGSIPTGGRFLHGALNGFSPRDTMAFFEALGVPLKTERGSRVFPVSDDARDIVEALRRHMEKTGVIHKRCKALGITAEGDGVTGVSATEGVFECGAVILATGGMSYSATGSTGDGYAFARALGHTVTPLRGSLVPLVTEPELCSRMQGLTLKNIRLAAFDGGKRPLFQESGELLSRTSAFRALWGFPRARICGISARKDTMSLLTSSRGLTRKNLTFEY